MTIKWTAQARGDLAAIREYIAPRLGEVCPTMGQQACPKGQVAGSDSPNWGRDVPEALEGEPLKEVMVGDYRIIYGLGID